MADIKWLLDPMHAEIQFKIRHLMISNVTGSFSKFNATVETTDDNFETAKVNFTAEVDSITTNNEQRDGHLKSADFFETGKYPILSFVSTKLEKVSGEDYILYGDLTFHGVTKNIKLNVEHGGVIRDPYGNTRTGFIVEGKINRKDYGLSWNAVTEAGGVVLSDDVKIHASVEFIKAA
ncbi:MAG TPA: YceI family protein [Puia sp.]|jgi:polyisoprenoid-binding protein YceI|nr:YceI family protein [Bacteroidota bacterium]